MASQAENSLQDHLFLSGKGTTQKLALKKQLSGLNLEKNINNLDMLYMEVLQNNGQEVN